MNRLNVLYDKLYQRYGELNWWPADTPYEVMVGAVLTQNTAWSNVEKAITNFRGRLSPEFVEAAKVEELVTIIRPAGFFNQKAAYLKELTKWYKRYGYSPKRVQGSKLSELRPELLSVKGVGKETADSILLYAFGFPTFVVDAYTKRMLKRLGFDIKPDYDTIKTYFEANMKKDTDLYNNFHALIVIHAKERCKAKPLCKDCPLTEECEKYKGDERI